LEHFKKITGIPMILNTSFNYRGEPIVCSPVDAVKTYYSTGIDALIIGNYLLLKENDNEITKS
jgi:carbamoyltransferase